MSTRDEPRSVRAAPTPAASSPRRAPSPTGGSPKKKRLEKERQIAQHRLIRADAPIVGNVGATAVRQESPCAAAVEVAPGLQAEPARLLALGYQKAPAQRVRQPTLRVQMEDARFRFGHLQVHRRP